MPQATLSTKGQLTIPKKVRESLHIESGDKIDFIITKNREAIIRPISKKVDEIFCKLHKPDRKAVALEEIDDLIRTRIKDKFK